MFLLLSMHVANRAVTDRVVFHSFIPLLFTLFFMGILFHLRIVVIACVHNLNLMELTFIVNL
jgi:hypothetical protein